MAEKINIGNGQYTYEFVPMLEQQIEKYMEQKNRQLPPIVNNGDYIACDEYKTPVEPIPWEDIPKWKNYFLSVKSHKETNLRNYAYFMLALNTMRRCGDLITLRIADVLNENGTIKDFLIIEEEQKTKIRSKTILRQDTKNALFQYLETMEVIDLSGWLFPAPRKLQADGTPDHVPYITMEKMMTRAEEKLQTGVHIGTHSLRKTIPTHIYKTAKDGYEAAAIMQAQYMLGHKSSRTTEHYLMVHEKQQNRIIQGLDF